MFKSDRVFCALTLPSLEASDYVRLSAVLGTSQGGFPRCNLFPIMGGWFYLIYRSLMHRDCQAYRRLTYTVDDVTVGREIHICRTSSVDKASLIIIGPD
jgi:hypothetical protein